VVKTPAAAPVPAAKTGRRVFLALDFGTSQVRAAVGRSYGAPLATAGRPIAYQRPSGGPETGLEFGPAEAWQAVVSASREALRESGVQIAQVAGIGVTSQRLGLVLLDMDGKELYAGPNRDARAVFEGAEVDAEAGDAIWRTTGHGPGMLLAWSKLLWFKRNAPGVYRRARTVAGIADWLVYRLTGVLAMECAQGVDSGLALVTTGMPAAAIGEGLGLEQVDLPVSCESGQVVGSLKSLQAQELGLRAGIPVVAVGPDAQAGLAGLGVAAPGSVGVIAGWSAVVQAVTARPVFDATRSMWTGRHVLPGRWVLEANAGEMGGAFAWLVSLINGRRPVRETYTRLDRLASACPPGARGASAFLGPSFVNMSGVGLKTGGILFPAPLAFEPPDAGSLARAAIENFAFAVRYNLDRIALTLGDRKDLAVGGGMAKSKTFCQTVAACTGEPVGFCVTGDATARGVLSLTGAAIGEGLPVEQALGRRRSELHLIEPKAAAAAEYSDLYDAWRLRERRVLDIDL